MITPDNTTTLEKTKQFTIKWAPRAIVAGLAGFYSLGFAYDIGLMASIDKVAIKILKHWFGYTGVGAFMPTIQWYAAWAVRFSFGLIGGLLYDLCERIIKFIYFKLTSKNLEVKPFTLSLPVRA